MRSDHYGRIDVLINNAGRGMWNSAESTDLDQYRGMMELNVFGPLAAMQAVIPFMRKQGGGVIINISSGVSRMFIPGLSAYASTKYALNAISLTARTELAADNIRVGIMLPGMTATDFGRNALGARPAGRGGLPLAARQLHARTCHRLKQRRWSQRRSWKPSGLKARKYWPAVCSGGRKPRGAPRLVEQPRKAPQGRRLNSLP